MNDQRLSELERRIVRSRHHLDATLREIECRLEPEHLVNQGLDYLRHSGANEFVANLGSSVKDNPLPVTFVALGMAWLMMTNKRADRGARAASDAVDSAYSESGQGIRAATATASEAAHDLRERASHSFDAARETLGRARDAYERVREQQPLALGAVGLAIGAAMALVLPRTRQDDATTTRESGARAADEARIADRERGEYAHGAAGAARSMHDAPRPTETAARQRNDPFAESAAERIARSRAASDGDDFWSPRGSPRDPQSGG